MAERWYLPIFTGPLPNSKIERIITYIQQKNLRDHIPRMCHERIQRNKYPEYLILGIVSEEVGAIPAEVNQMIHDLGPWRALDQTLSYEQVHETTWISGEIETTSFARQIKPSLMNSIELENPFDLSPQENIEGETESYNRLLYWLSAVGSGTWQSFVKVCELLGLISEKTGARHLFRRLRLLGHVEYLDDGAKWAVCPACLVQKDTDHEVYFLTGQRTPVILETLKKNIFWEPISQIGGPQIIRLSKVKNIQNVVEGTPIRLAGKAGQRLAEILPDLQEWQTSLKAFSIPYLSYQIHRWDGNDFTQWVEQPIETGMYRYKKSSDTVQYFTFYDPQRGNLRGDWYGLRFLANRYLNKPAQVLENLDFQVIIPHEEHLPEIYERVLVLASGCLPQVNDSGVVYSGISPTLIHLLSAKLSFEIKDYLQ